MACVPSATICRVRGDTFPFDVLLKDASGAAIDISGTTALLTVDPSPEPVDALANLFQLAGAIVGPGTDGRFRFTLSAGDADQTPGAYFFDIEWTSGAAVRTVLKGDFEFEQDITK